jgi:hypothetical protein
MWAVAPKTNKYISYSYSRSHIIIYSPKACKRVSFIRHKNIPLCALYEIQFSWYEDRKSGPFLLLPPVYGGGGDAKGREYLQAVAVDGS